MKPTLATHLAAFICGLEEDTLPADVTDKARTCLLNGFGIGYAGLGTPYHVVAARTARAMYGDGGDATLLADGTKSTVSGAVLANGALFHGRAQEDTCGAAHLGAVMIPLLTALIETDRAAIDDLIPSLVAGYEAGGVFEELLAIHSTPLGFRATTVYGVIAAAAASARLLGLTPDQTVAALNNAVSLSGGLLQSFVEGTDEWRYQVGTTAHLGWTATELARAGSTSARSAFEGSKGLAAAFARSEIDVARLASGFGHNWQTLRVAFKPFPVCAFNQTPVTAALELRKKIDVTRIESVAVHMNPYECGYAGMDARGPFHSISGTLMSIPFCIAQALLRGAPTMTSMTTYDDAEVNALESRIDLVPDDDVQVLSCRIVTRLSDGTMYDELCEMTPADYAYGFDDMSRRLKWIADQEGLDATVIDTVAAFCMKPTTEALGRVISGFQSK